MADTKKEVKPEAALEELKKLAAEVVRCRRALADAEERYHAQLARLIPQGSPLFADLAPPAAKGIVVQGTYELFLARIANLVSPFSRTMLIQASDFADRTATRCIEQAVAERRIRRMEKGLYAWVDRPGSK